MTKDINELSSYGLIPHNLIPLMAHPASNSWVNVPDGQGGTKRIRYDLMVALLFKQEAFKDMVNHAKGGCCEEAGELSSILKKHITYGQPLSQIIKEDGQTLFTHIIEELGDLKFFIQVIQNLFGISEQAILQHNANKLSVRYAGLAYSDVAALIRLDKDTGPVSPAETSGD